MRKIASILILSALIVSSFAVLIPAQSLGAAPPASISNTTYLNTTSLTGYKNDGTYSSGSSSISAVEATKAQTASTNEPVSFWTLRDSNYIASATINFGSYQWWGPGGGASLNDWGFLAGVGEINAETYDYNIGTIYANLSVDGSTYSWSWSPNTETAGGYPRYIYINPYWDTSVPIGYYDVVVHFNVTGNGANSGYTNGAFGTAPPKYGFTSTNYNGEFAFKPAPTDAGANIPFAYGWTYSGRTTSASWTNPGSTDALQFYYSSPYALSWQSAAATTSSTTTYSGNVESGTFSDVSGDPNVPSFTITWDTPNVIVGVSASLSLSNTTTITESGNWWNRTITFPGSSTISGWLNGATVAGTAWPTTADWNVNHVRSAGYGSAPAYDQVFISGYSTSNYAPSATYGSFSDSDANYGVIAITYHIDEAINYDPQVSQVQATFSGTGSQADLTFVTAEQIAGEKETIQIWWAASQTTPDTYSGVTPGALSYSHSYTDTGTYAITLEVTNEPNGNFALSQQNSTTYSVVLNTLPAPAPLSVLQTGSTIWMNFTESNLHIDSASLTVNGFSASVSGSGESYHAVNSMFGAQVVDVTWTLSTTDGFSHSFSYTYGSVLVPGANDSYLTVLGSNSPLNITPINLTGVPSSIQQTTITLTGSPSGSGYYQQLLTIPLTSSINPSLGNFYFADSAGKLYAWVQSYNSTDMSVWVKIPNGTASITMYSGFPTSLYSANGHIGLAPQLSTVYAEYDNGASVFPHYWNFSGTTLPKGWTEYNSVAVHVNNGINISSPSKWAGIRSNATVGNNTVVTSYGYLAQPETNGVIFAGAYNGYGFGEGVNDYAIGDIASGGVTAWNTGASFPTTSFYQLFRFYDISGNLQGYANQTKELTYTGTFTGTSNLLLAIYNNSGLNSMVIQYFFSRSHVQSGMPTFSLSAESTAPESVQSTAYYQQLIVIGNSTVSFRHYGITAAASNFYIESANLTPYYTWIQSINGNNLTLWSKIPYSSTGKETLELQVFPSFENLLGNNSYLGNASDTGVEQIVFGSGNVMLSYSTVNTSSEIVLPNHYGFGFIVSITAFTQYIQVKDATNTNNMMITNESTGNPYAYDRVSGTAVSADHNTTILMKGLTSGYMYYSGYNGNWGTNGIAFSENATTYESYSSLNIYCITADFQTIFAFNDTAMPSFGIGSGVVFQANATGTNRLHYALVSTNIYNNTESAMTYDIYDSYSWNYITAIYNASWQFQYSYPNPTTGGNDVGGKYLTWAGISGVGQITATFLQPSPLIGSTAYVVVQPEQNNNSLQLSGIHLVADYYPYDSSVQETTTAYALEIGIPFGSVANIYLYNEWDQPLGSIRNYIVNQQFPTVQMAVSVSTLSFDFTNSSEQFVTLAANGISYSFFGTAIVAMNGTYFWTTQVYNLYEGKNVNYTGSVAITKTQQVLVISTDAPPSSLTITITGYSASGITLLGYAGTPTVTLWINGQQQPIGSTYIGFVGSTYEIQVKDVLGNVLYSKNVTLQTTYESLQAQITKPSWEWSIQNEEQVSKSSQLATEYIAVNANNSHSYYNFTNQVGQEAVLYLLQGTYNVSLHDNATFNATFLLNENENYVIFGQSLLTLQEFDSKINEILNNTNGIELQTIQSVSNVVPAQSISFEIAAYFTNGTQLSHAELENASLYLAITNSTGTVAIQTTIAVVGKDVYYNFSAPVAGQYTVVIAVLYGGASGRVSYLMTVEAITVTSKGMILSATGPDQAIINQTYNYTLSVDYGNYTAMTSKDTWSVFNNTTITIFNGIDPVQQAVLMNHYAGVITFNATFNRTGGYSLYIGSHVVLRAYASATALVPVEVYPASRIVNGSIMMQLSTAQTSLLNGTENFTETLGGFLNSSILATAYADSVLYVYAGSSTYLTIHPSGHSGDSVFFSHSFNATGNYSAVAQLNVSGQVLTATVSFQVEKLQTFGVGLDILILGPSTIQVNTTNTYGVSLHYLNGSLLSASDTHIVFGNTTVEVFDANKFVEIVPLTYYSPGILSFKLNLSTLSSSYEIYAIVTHSRISIGNVSAAAPFNVQTSLVSPTNPLGPLSGIISIFTPIGDFLVTWGTYILTAAGLLVLGYGFIRLLRRREVANKLAAQGDYAYIKWNVFYKVTTGQSLTQKETEIYYGTPKEERKYFSDQFNLNLRVGQREMRALAKHPHAGGGGK